MLLRASFRVQLLTFESNEDGEEQDVGEEGEPAQTSDYTKHRLARRESANRVDRIKLCRAEPKVMGKRKGGGKGVE